MEVYCTNLMINRASYLKHYNAGLTLELKRLFLRWWPVLSQIYFLFI